MFKQIFFFFFNVTDSNSILFKLNTWAFLNIKSLKYKSQLNIFFYINSLHYFNKKSLLVFFKNFSYELFFYKIYKFFFFISILFFLVSMILYNVNDYKSTFGSYFFIFYYFKSWSFSLFFFFFLFFLYVCVFYFFVTNYSSISMFKMYYFKKIINFFLITQILVFFFFFFLNFFFYICYATWSNSFFLGDWFIFSPKFIFSTNINFYFLNFFSFNLVLDFFSFSLIFLAYIVGFVALFILDTRIFWQNYKYLTFFNIFILIVYIYSTVSNLILFFFSYECLLLPSFLFVFSISPSKRAIQASIYFVIWTQIGSILVLLVISYFLIILNVYDFFCLKNIVFSSKESFFIYFLLFLGFGFKVPIWPFHYWITKTHVEAPSGFSVYLSGFLVKTALFGFYKITNSLICFTDNYLFVLICFFGVFDASFKMWGQLDLKKLAAYATIQEMNLIYVMILFGDTQFIFYAVLFVITHAFLSCYMFFLVDCVYKRFSSRSIIIVSGILNLCPLLGVFIICMLILFSALPGTLKFNVEFILFEGMLEFSFFFVLILMLVSNVFGLIGFSKVWFNSIFGLNSKKKKYKILDLTFKEIFLSFFFIFFLFFFSFFVNYFYL